MHSYNASKLQMKLMIAALECRTLENASTSNVAVPNGEFHHYIISPGITAKNMNTLLNIPIPGYRYLMLAAFYIVCIAFSSHDLYSLTLVRVRFIDSPHVLLSLQRSGCSSPLRTHLAPRDLDRARHRARPARGYRLAKLAFVLRQVHKGCGAPRLLTLRFGAENDRWGNGRPRVMVVPVWKEHPDAGAQLLERLKRLYQVSLLNSKEAEGASGAAANEHAG